jgi:hypothetical protein
MATAAATADFRSIPPSPFLGAPTGATAAGICPVRQLAQPKGERFDDSSVRNIMNMSTMSPGRKTIRRGPGQQIVAGKGFRMADEVSYIQCRAADHHGRIGLAALPPTWIELVKPTLCGQAIRCLRLRAEPAFTAIYVLELRTFGRRMWT